MRMVRWMCDVKVKDSFKYRIERSTRIRCHNLSTTAKHAALVWVCIAKRRQRLGEEMYGV